MQHWLKTSDVNEKRCHFYGNSVFFPCSYENHNITSDNRNLQQRGANGGRHGRISSQMAGKVSYTEEGKK